MKIDLKYLIKVLRNLLKSLNYDCFMEEVLDCLEIDANIQTY